MSKFATVSTGRKTTNYVNAPAYKYEDKTNLASTVLTTFVEVSYYESKEKRIERITMLVEKLAKSDPEFVAKLAIYARRVFHLRSVFPLVIAKLAKVHNGDNLVSRAIFAGATRLDDLTEIVAACGGKAPFSAQVKKGIAAALPKFDAYQLAKYRAEGKTVKLVDLFNLVSPVPSDAEQSTTWKMLLDGDLKQTGQTWEARLSAGEDQNVVWREMLSDDELGYMACLRNLRNIAKHCNAETVNMAANLITNKDRLISSKQLPFRFISAYKALTEAMDGDGASGDGFKFELDSKSVEENIVVLRGAVNTALTMSVENIPLLDGESMILSDNSGSMRGDRGGSSVVSAHSNRQTADVANLFATMYWMRAQNTFLGLFGDRLIQPKLDRTLTLMENYAKTSATGHDCGEATEAGAFHAFEWLIKHERKPNRIFVFTDCQIGRATFYDTDGGRTGRQGNDFNKLYQQFRSMSPGTIVYSVDLRGYGNTVFADGVVQLFGWSDQIFEMARTFELGTKRLFEDINAVEL